MGALGHPDKMEYHLHHQGQNLGVFSLDELRRRRDAGELSGNELVWRQGMSNWQTLDSVLQSGEIMRPSPPPLPVSGRPRPSNQAALWITVAVIGFIAIYATFIAVLAPKFAQQVRVAQQTARRVAQQRGSSSEGVEVASRAITTATNSATEADVKKREKEFRIRQWLDGYKERGSRNPRWDADAVRLIELWIAKTYDEDLPTNQISVEQLGDKLATDGECDDPLVLTAAAINSIELHEKYRRLERALKRFEGSKHRGYPKFYASVTLATDDPDRVRTLDGAALRFFKESFTDGSFLAADEPEIAEILLNVGRPISSAEMLPRSMPRLPIRESRLSGSRWFWKGRIMSRKPGMRVEGATPTLLQKRDGKASRRIRPWLGAHLQRRGNCGLICRRRQAG